MSWLFIHPIMMSSVQAKLQFGDASFGKRSLLDAKESAPKISSGSCSIMQSLTERLL
jgi:hypothetical protein